ncbi:hypothetical protein BBJ28_00010541 [Nothophytophthora sp. Chile5]|nr:hypothetical protein BBJ28_00010541 [Nothophytophthora sp. Chile5]
MTLTGSQVLADVYAAPAAGFSADWLLDALLAVREQFLTLLDAEACVLSFETASSGSLRSVEFDGREIRPIGDHPPVERSAGVLAARRRARATRPRPTYLSTASACSQHRVALSGAAPVQSYLCLPLVDCSEHVQAVVEVVNARYDAAVIASWLGDCEPDGALVCRSISATIEPLRVFCSVVGALLRVCQAPLTAVISPTTATFKPMTSGGSRGDDKDVRTTLVRLLDLLQRTTGVGGWVLYAHDQEAKVLWAQLASRDVKADKATLPIGHGVIGRAASTAEPLYDDAVLCVPTFDYGTDQRVNGVVVLYGVAGRAAFRQADVALCSAVCRHVGSALQRLALQEAAVRAQKKAQAVLELSEIIYRELERGPKPTTLLLAVAQAVADCTWLKVADCRVYLKDPATRELYAPDSESTGEYRVPVPAGSATATAAARSGEAASSKPSCSPRESPSTRSVLAVPIKDPSGAVLGVLELVDKQSEASTASAWLEKRFFDQEDEDFVLAIARQVALALRNAQRLETARAAQRKSAALLSLRLPAATGTLPGEQAGAVFAVAEAAACRALRASHGALFIVDAPSRSLFARVGADWRGYSLPMGQLLQGRVAASGAAVRLARDARTHPEFDQEYDRLMGIQTNSLLCVPIKAQPSLLASSSSSSSSFAASGRSGRRCSSSFSTSSSTDEDGDDRPVIGVFYAANKLSAKGEAAGFDCEDEMVLRSICSELAALIERRAWELVFESPTYDGSDSSDSEGEGHVTRTFLSQYTARSPSRRRRRPRSRLPSVASDHDHAAAVVAATSFHEGCFLSSSGGCGLLAPLPGELSRAASQGGSHSPVLQWELDPWEYSPAQLIDLAVDMFELHDLLDGFALPEATLRRFLHGVQSQYQDVPYHNTYHAFATLHVSFLLLSAQSHPLAASLLPAATSLGLTPTTKAQAIEQTRQKRCGELLLAPKERLAVFVAAFCHDMGHDARTNDFHVRCGSRLARRYNDHSVLENMHAAACFETMRRPGHDVLAGLADGTAGTRRAVRKRVIRAILATDMHRHAGIVVKLHDAQLRGRQNDDEALRELLVDAVVHSADISGPTLSCAQHFRWTSRLLEEFNEQYEEEKALGLVPATFMNARPGSAEDSRVNLVFVDSCAFPLWRALGGLLAGLEGCLANLQRNRAMWVRRVEEATALEAQEEGETQEDQVEIHEEELETQEDQLKPLKVHLEPLQIPTRARDIPHRQGRKKALKTW